MSISQNDCLLVVGAGSIGERHINNLRQLGYANILVLRSRKQPMRSVAEDSVEIVTSWEQALKRNPKAAFVCTPTALHCEHTLHCLQAGIHTLVEKPISHSMEGMHTLIKAVKTTNAWLQIGYMMRYHPFVSQIKSFIEHESFGKLISFSSYWGEYLPSWHPWENYRESYAARKDLGGGAALTLSHDVDLALHIVDSPLLHHSTLLNNRASLEVDTDSAADFLLGFKNGVTGHVHQNFFQKQKCRKYLFEFEAASVAYQYFQNRMEISTESGMQLINYPDFDRNSLFIDQAKDFLSKITTSNTSESVENILQGFRIVALCKDKPQPY